MVAGKRVAKTGSEAPSSSVIRSLVLQKVRTLRGLGPQQASPSWAAQRGRRAIDLLRGQCSMPPRLPPGSSEQTLCWERTCSIPVFSIKLSFSFDKKQFFPFLFYFSPSIASSSPSHCSPPPPRIWIPVSSLIPHALPLPPSPLSSVLVAI